MAELKTRESKASVAGFLKQIPDPARRKDAGKLLAMMKSATKEKPRMWGSSTRTMETKPGARAI